MFCLFISYMYNCISMFIYLISSYFDRSLYYRCTNIFSVIHLKSRINAHYEVTAKVSKIFSRIWLFRSLSIGHKVQDLCDIYVSFYTLKVENNKNFPRSHCQLSKLTFWNRLFISNSHGSKTTSWRKIWVKGAVHISSAELTNVQNDSNVWERKLFCFGRIWFSSIW